MFKEILDNGYVTFEDTFDDWEEAVRCSYKPLLDAGIVENQYVKAVIDCIHEFGPYIVLVPGIAMPHSSQGAQGCHGTAISFMRVQNPVDFDASDPDKKARLFFSLASLDAQKHLENIEQLMGTLMNEEFVEALYGCDTLEKLQQAVATYEV